MVREEKTFIWTCDKCKQYRHPSKGFEPLLPAGWSERLLEESSVLTIHICPQCVRAEKAAAEKLEREKHKAESEARVAAEAGAAAAQVQATDPDSELQEARGEL